MCVFRHGFLGRPEKGFQRKGAEKNAQTAATAVVSRIFREDGFLSIKTLRPCAFALDFKKVKKLQKKVPSSGDEAEA